MGRVAKRNPEIFYCPVCGARLKPFWASVHTCNPGVLNGIDAADSRAWNDELDPHRSRAPFWRTEGMRMAEGFMFLQDDFQA